MQGNLVSMMIGVMIFVVIGVAVTVPIVIDTVNNVSADVTGTNKTILLIIPTLVIVLILSVIAGYMA